MESPLLTASVYVTDQRRPRPPPHPTRAHTKTTVFALYAVAIRRVVGTMGQPLRSAKSRRARLLAAVFAEKASPSSDLAGGDVGPAAQAAAREAMEAMPFPYLPGVGAMLLTLVAVTAHVLLVLGRRWSVRFHAWWVGVTC